MEDDGALGIPKESPEPEIEMATDFSFEFEKDLAPKKEIDFQKKYNYKIRIKSTGKFITATRSKTTWLRPSAVIDMLDSLIKNYNAYKGASFKYKIEDLEVVLIPLQEMETVSVSDFIESYEKKNKTVKAKKADRKRKAEIANIENEIASLAIKKEYLQEKIEELTKKLVD